MSSCAYCLAAKLHEIAFKKRIRDEMMVKTKDLKIAVNRKVKLSQEALNTFSKRMRNNRTSGVVVEESLVMVKSEVSNVAFPLNEVDSPKSRFGPIVKLQCVALLKPSL